MSKLSVPVENWFMYQRTSSLKTLMEILVSKTMCPQFDLDCDMEVHKVRHCCHQVETLNVL